MKLKELFETTGGKLPSYWFGRYDEEIDVGTDTHIGYAIRNPELFGLTTSIINQDKEDIMDALFIKGWTRVTGGSGNIGIQASNFFNAAFALKKYLDIVGEVQHIEIDIKDQWYRLPPDSIGMFLKNPRSLPNLSRNKI